VGLAIPGAAIGQETSVGLEEIVVTAQKREESLQDTPISITAFTASGMEKLGVTNIQELGAFTPNVTFDFTSPISGASNAASIFIRGIGQSDFALTTEAGVGTYVDGIYMSRSVGGVLDVLDIERIEVLRGPQGTLFGRNTIGGAINITTMAPGPDFGGHAEVSVGDNSRVHLRTSVNIPISESLFVRLSASSKDRDGFVKGLLGPDLRSVPPGDKAIPGGGITSQTDLGNENRSAVRGTFLWEASPTFSATLSADFARIRENNAADILVGTTGSPLNGPVVFVYNTFEAPGRTLPGFDNAFYTDENFVTGDLKTTYSTGPNGSSIDGWGVGLTLEWDALDNLTIKSLTSYRDTDGYFNRDADGSPIDLTHTSNYDYQHEQFSQELQFIGDLMDSRLNYAAGIYYFEEEGSDPLVVDFPESFGNLFLDQVDIDNRSIAGYAQATFDVTDRIALTGGIRYTKDKKKFFTDQYIVTGTASPIVFGAPAGTVIPLVPRNSQAAETFTDWSPRASIDFQVTDELLGYGSYTQGFKSGGFNLRYVLPREAVLPFDPEEVETWELGFKWEGLNRRLRVNGAAFYTDYSNVQVTIFENLGAPVTLNTGEAEIKGFELEFITVPVPNLQISGGIGYTDAKYTELRNISADLPASEQIVTLDTKLANTPEWQFSAAADYTVPMGASGEVDLHLDWSFSDDVHNDAQNSPFLFQKSYHLLNASVTYISPNDDWRLRFFVDNLTDKRIIVSGDSNFGIGFHEANYNRPREWGVSLRVNF
jgi:iron complex outermembrane receptor protein